MIRECNASDLETLEAYLKEEVYGKVILSLIEKNGFEQAAQSVYGDFEIHTKEQWFVADVVIPLV